VDHIFVNGRLMRIRKNLRRFLCQARDLVPNRFDWLWIDAVCINQSDNRERMHQVELMAKIFQAASSVIVWLGPGYGGSEGALDYFNNRRASGSSGNPPNMHRGRVTNVGSVSLCYRPYWRRLWILQEIVFARRIWLMCGDRISPWQPFRDTLLSIQRFFAATVSVRPMLGDSFESTSILNSPAMTIVGLTERRAHSRSLHVLLFNTKFLQCAERLDKVYALLNIAGAGGGTIQPDYDAVIEDLLNAVLRNYHKSKLPESLEKVVNQCDALEELFDLEQSSMFRRNGVLHVGTGTSATNKSEIHFGPSGMPITWWWILAHGHTQLEHIFWHEFAPDILSFYHEAAEAGEVFALEALFDRAEFDVYFDRKNSQPLILAARNGHTDVIRLLLQKGLHDRPNFVSYPYDAGPNALCIAISQGYHATVEALVITGAEIDTANRDGIAPLVYAVIHGRLDIVQLLLDHGANVDGGTDGTSLSKSAEYDRFEIFELLLHRGARFSARDVVETIVQSRRAHELTKAVVNFGFNRGLGFVDDLRVVSFINQAFHCLCKRARTDVIETLLESRFLCQLRYSDRAMILRDVVREAANFELWKTVRLLLDHGADVNAHHYGVTMLHTATFWGNVSAVKMLLEQGADVQRAVDHWLDADTFNRYHKFGWPLRPVTALKIAQKKGYAEIEQVLLASIRLQFVEVQISRKRRRPSSTLFDLPPIRYLMK
jgi:ankyrin repeat protein